MHFFDTGGESLLYCFESMLASNDLEGCVGVELRSKFRTPDIPPKALGNSTYFRS